MDYIFGYGSIINDTSRLSTCSSPTRKGKGFGSYSSELKGDESGGGAHDLAVAARLSSRFAKRVWNFRCPTGFTALGIVLSPDVANSDTEAEIFPRSEEDGVDKNGECDRGINGVLFPVINQQDLMAFDIREVGYTRVSVPLQFVSVLPQFGCSSARNRALELQSVLLGADEHSEEPLIWVYVPDSSHSALPSVDYPILQTYVDVCIEGCLVWGGKQFAMDFLKGTSSWSEFYLNDTPMSRRPWLHRKDYKRVDECLKEVSGRILFSCRKHPDEFASLHLTSLRGMFGIPPRNRTFIGRETFIQCLHSKLVGEHDFESTDDVLWQGVDNNEIFANDKDSVGLHEDKSYRLQQVEIAGIGGVGKSQIAIEYAHRYYSSSGYALVAWFRGESAASVATDMRKLAFELGIIHNQDRNNISVEHTTDSLTTIGRKASGISDNDKNGDDYLCSEVDKSDDFEGYDDAYIINELMRRLGLCRFKWLFIFDNVDDPEMLSAFLPRRICGNGAGHVIVTSRVQHREWVLRGTTLTLDCFDPMDSVKYLQCALGNISAKEAKREETNGDKTLAQLSVRLGNLPLALAMAVAYMIRCDVSPAEYLKHISTSSDVNIDAIAASLGVTLTRIREESLSATCILPCLGFLAPDNITKGLIQLCLVTAYHKSHGPQIDSGNMNDENIISIRKSSTKGPQNVEGLESAEIIETKYFTSFMFLVSVLWAMLLHLCMTDRFDVNVLNFEEVATHDFLKFHVGVASGCLLMLDVIAVIFYMCPGYRLCVVSFVNISEPILDESGTDGCSDSVTPLSKRTADRYKQFLHLVESRHHCQITSNIVSEADKVWEILKQFSLLSVRAGNGNGSVHRLQQAVLRTCRDMFDEVHGDVERLLCLERCIWVLYEKWNFSKSDPSTWQHAGTIIEHIQVIAKYAIDSLRNESVDSNIRVEYFLLLSDLLREGGVYTSIVLSRFDSAQLLLEWSHRILSYLLQVLSSPSKAQKLAVEFKINFRNQAYKYLAVTLFSLGKVLRYNDRLAESEVALKQSLEINRNHQLEDSRNSGAIADILHELGVLYLRKHDLYTAKTYLMRSLDIKQTNNFFIQETDESATLHQLGVVATLERRYDDAELLLLQSLELDETQSHKSFTKNLSQRNMTCRAATLQQLGRVELRRGRLPEADKFLSEALTLYVKSYGEGRAASHVNVAGVRHQLGKAAMASKNYDMACEHFSFALAAREIICSQSSGGKDQVIAALLALGQAEVERDRYDVAETLFLRARSAIEIDLCDTNGCDENSFNVLDISDNRSGNFSIDMLSKCGYGNEQVYVEDSKVAERRRDGLVKQLYFCVHLLRGVARQRGDATAVRKYTLELKNMRKSYPSQRHKNEKVDVAATGTSHLLESSDMSPGDSVLIFESNASIFESINGSNFDGCGHSICRSKLYIEQKQVHTSTCCNGLKDAICKLAAIRCSVRWQCKVMQKDDTNRFCDSRSCFAILNVVQEALSEELMKLQRLDSKGIAHVVQSFVDDASGSECATSCDRKQVLAMLYQLCDDVRAGIKPYGFRIDDL